jgi:hypothetical protein
MIQAIIFDKDLGLGAKIGLKVMQTACLQAQLLDFACVDRIE